MGRIREYSTRAEGYPVRVMHDDGTTSPIEGPESMRGKTVPCECCNHPEATGRG